MRTHMQKTVVYRFNELSDEGKTKAIEKYREIAHEDFDAEYIIDDTADIADLFGLDIRQTRKVNGKGESRYVPTVYWSGFSSQGDGACFEGAYSYKKGALKTVKKYVSTDTELHRIVKSLQDLQKRYSYGLQAHTTHRGYYYHSGCMVVDVEHVDNINIPDNIQEGITECLRDFANWIYKRLESEWDYIHSDERITEWLSESDYEFTEDGEIFY